MTLHIHEEYSAEFGNKGNTIGIVLNGANMDYYDIVVQQQGLKSKDIPQILTLTG